MSHFTGPLTLNFSWNICLFVLGNICMCVWGGRGDFRETIVKAEKYMKFWVNVYFLIWTKLCQRQKPWTRKLAKVLWWGPGSELAKPSLIWVQILVASAKCNNHSILSSDICRLRLLAYRHLLWRLANIPTTLVPPLSGWTKVLWDFWLWK